MPMHPTSTMPDYDPETPIENLPPDAQARIIRETYDVDRLRRHLDGDPEETIRALEEQPRPIDLTGIPVEDWPRYVSLDVIIPEYLHRWIESQAEMDRTVCDHIEDSLTSLYRVQAPYCIYFDAELQTARLLAET